jgi:lysophospholipase L1-like esterase
MLLLQCGRSDPLARPDAGAMARVSQDAVTNPMLDGATFDAAPGTTTTKTEVAAPPGIFRMGRFDDDGKDGLRFAWSGSTLRARFRGHSARVRLADELGHNYFRVKVDDTIAVVETKQGEHTYMLAEDLRDGEHALELVKRTEARSGEVTLRALELPHGELLPEPPHKQRHLEILGDSISTGWGVLGVDDVACPDAAKLTDETLTAGALVAEMLDAEHTTIAWSAKTIREVTTLWERTLPARENSAWDFSRVPDAVIVNLGTNDFYTGDPGRDAFVRRYVALHDKLRAHYIQSWIVVVLGPMLSDAYPENKHHYTLAQGHMRAAMDEIRARGETRISLVDFGPADPKDGYGCRFHPNQITQHKMADAIARVLRESLSW